MVAVQALSIAVLVRDRLQQRQLRSVIEACGHRASTAFLLDAVCASPALQQDAASQTVDAWILIADSSGEPESDWLEADWLAALQGIIIYADDPPLQMDGAAYHNWVRRLDLKLRELAGTINLAQEGHRPAREVWLLAASTGGPAAVRQFIRALPSGLDVGFVYAQHIDPGYEGNLLKVFGQSEDYPAYPVEHGGIVRANGLAIVSPQRATELLPNGTFIVNDQVWPGPYGPSIDSMLASLARSYGPRSGVIVFSGMGDDGALGCRLMRKGGGKVWVQTPESCTVDSMPRAALATGCVDSEGTPLGLACQLVKACSVPARLNAALQTKTVRVCYD